MEENEMKNAQPLQTIPEHLSLQQIYDWIKQKRNLSEEQSLNVYPWGSRVYGCSTKESDWDLLIVTNEPPISPWTNNEPPKLTPNFG